MKENDIFRSASSFALACEKHFGAPLEKLRADICVKGAGFMHPTFYNYIPQKDNEMLYFVERIDDKPIFISTNLVIPQGSKFYIVFVSKKYVSVKITSAYTINRLIYFYGEK